jgi:hypothetical protein
MPVDLLLLKLDLQRQIGQLLLFSRRSVAHIQHDLSAFLQQVKHDNYPHHRYRNHMILVIIAHFRTNPYGH